MGSLFKTVLAILVVLVLHLYFYGSDYVKRLDHKIYDATGAINAQFREKEGATYSVIVDVDEKSTQEFGQWPWPRIMDAELINLIDEMHPSAIGVNILFPEADRLSPLSIQQFYQTYFDVKVNLESLPSALHDNDKFLADVIQKSQATLPVYLQNRYYSQKHCEAMSYHQNIFKNIKSRFSAEELLCNHPSIQKGVENFGFINAWSDGDGVFRRVPLFMHYKEEVFPSFALATVLSFYQAIDIDKKEDMVLVNFSLNRPKVIAAADVLNGSISKEQIQGKVVIVGSSLVGLNRSFKISTGEEVSSSMIQAMLVDNILNHSFIIQPQFYKKMNVVFSFFLFLVVWLLLSKRAYSLMVMMLLALGVVSIVSLFLMYQKGVYISMGYLWIPFFSLFGILLIHHLWVLNKEQQEQEKLFIRQSKLASMGEMIALIAHQWRQPLSAINGVVLNMDMDYRKQTMDRERFNNYLDEIEQTTTFLSKTINDFTDFFAKNKEPHRFKVSLVIKQAKRLSLKGSACHLEVIYKNAEEVEINGYASELVQSLLVLLNNAIYVCQKNLSHTKEGKIFIHVAKENKEVVISVEDNGGGIAEKDMKKIFNPYFTTKEKQNGTGLGLYILRLIVEESMNGKISVVNTQEGAMFTIRIPTNL